MRYQTMKIYTRNLLLAGLLSCSGLVAAESPAPYGPGMGMGPGMGPGMGQGTPGAMGPGSPTTMGPGRGRAMPAFADFDLNGDGSLQRQEFEQARAERIRERAEQGYMMRNLKNAPAFETIDTDGNGQVSPEEFTAAQAQHRLQR